MTKTITTREAMLHTFDTATMPVGKAPRISAQRKINWLMVALMVALTVTVGPLPLVIAAVVYALRHVRSFGGTMARMAARLNSSALLQAGLIALCLFFPLGGAAVLIATRGTGTSKVRTAAIVIVAYRLLASLQPALVAIGH